MAWGQNSISDAESAALAEEVSASNQWEEAVCEIRAEAFISRSRFSGSRRRGGGRKIFATKGTWVTVRQKPGGKVLPDYLQATTISRACDVYDDVRMDCTSTFAGGPLVPEKFLGGGVLVNARDSAPEGVELTKTFNTDTDCDVPVEESGCHSDDMPTSVLGVKEKFNPQAALGNCVCDICADSVTTCHALGAEMQQWPIGKRVLNLGERSVLPSCCAADVRPVPRPGCLTDENRPCAFPFTYNGHVYNSCTEENHGYYWCSYTAQYDDDWGTCMIETAVGPVDPPTPLPVLRPCWYVHNWQWADAKHRLRGLFVPIEFQRSGQECVGECDGEASTTGGTVMFVIGIIVTVCGVFACCGTIAIVAGSSRSRTAAARDGRGKSAPSGSEVDMSSVPRSSLEVVQPQLPNKSSIAMQSIA